MKKHTAKKTHKNHKQEEKNLEEILIDEIYSKATNESFWLSYFEELLKDKPELAEKVSRKYWDMSAEDLILENKSRIQEEEIENNEIEEIYEKVTTDENFGASYFAELIESKPELAEKIAQNKWWKSAKELISEHINNTDEIEQITQIENLSISGEGLTDKSVKKQDEIGKIWKWWLVFFICLFVILGIVGENKEWLQEYGLLTLFFVIIWIIVLFLFTKKWFWIIVLFFWWLASCFSMIASIIYFQILGAIGFFILMCICWWILSLIKEIE